ncbi:magnesium ion transporter [Ptychographa xylographoides]|nr:magnesium ion transporter [Ptychographa xylographoides]
MELTRIRIRGKKKRSPRSSTRLEGTFNKIPIPALARKRGRPRKYAIGPAFEPPPSSRPSSSPANVGQDISSAQLHLSALERLPLELLQIVFLLEPNLDLPKASPHLCIALASRHLRTELVIQAFAADSTHDNSRLQSQLLRQKWLTYSFFQQCQKVFFLREAIRIYRSRSAATLQTIQTTTIKRMTDFFDDYYILRNRLRAQLTRWQNRTDHESDDTTDAQIKMFGDGGDGMLYQFTIEHEGRSLSCKELISAEAKEGDGNGQPYQSYEIMLMPRVMSACDIPEKLLHGPWTSERGNFLKLLLIAGANIDRVDSSSGEVAEIGLEDAIREENVCALKLLVAGGRVDYASRVAELNECTRLQAEKQLTLEALSDPEGKLRLISCVDDHSIFQPLGVIPTTKHLRIAVLEMGCNLNVVDSLLFPGIRRNAADIDPDDPALLHWALKNKVEAREEDRVVSPIYGGYVNRGQGLLTYLDLIRNCHVRNQPQ